MLGERLRRMVLASTSQLRAGTGLSEDQAKRAVRELREAKLVETGVMGRLQPAVPLLRFTKAGMRYFGLSDGERIWHGPDGLGNVINYDLPKLEAVNKIAPLYETPDWQLWQVQLYEREPQFAVAEYRYVEPDLPVMAWPYRGPGEHLGPDEEGPRYVAFCCASVMDNQRELAEKLQALPDRLRAYSTRPEQGFLPSAVAIIGFEEWPLARALSMARKVLHRWVEPSGITDWFYGGDGWRMSDATSVLTGRPPDSLPSLLPAPPPLRRTGSVRKLGNQRFESVLDRCPWNGREGPGLFELLTKVCQYPAAAISHYKVFVGEASEGTETERRIAALIRKGLVEVVTAHARVRIDRLPRGVPATISARGQGGHRYAPTKSGRTAFCRAHGGSPGALARRTKLGLLRAVRKGVPTDLWPYRHEDTAYEAMAQFCEMGCSIAPGWQARVTLADGKRIYPDGMVLVTTPWGRLRCFLEVELSDRSYSAVFPRVKRYASLHRRDSHPALFVCHDDRAERAFVEAQRQFDPPPKMLTATLRQLRDGGVAGADWSLYGRPFTLTV